MCEIRTSAGSLASWRRQELFRRLGHCTDSGTRGPWLTGYRSPHWKFTRRARLQLSLRTDTWGGTLLWRSVHRPYENEAEALSQQRVCRAHVQAPDPDSHSTPLSTAWGRVVNDGEAILATVHRPGLSTLMSRLAYHARSPALLQDTCIMRAKGDRLFIALAGPRSRKLAPSMSWTERWSRPPLSGAIHTRQQHPALLGQASLSYTSPRL